MVKKNIVTDEDAQEAYVLAKRMREEEEVANKHSEVENTYWADIVAAIEWNAREHKAEVKVK